MPKANAIDISAYQGKLSVGDFRKIGDDIAVIIMRTSYTSQSEFKLNKDKVFEHNIKAAHKAGKKVGAYHYSQAISETEAIKEAKYVLDIVRPYRSILTYNTICIDWEFGGRLNSYVARKLGKQRCKQIIDAFCRTIRNAGYIPLVYANLSTLNGYIANDLYKSWHVWVAQYHSSCDYAHPFMWQFTSSGHVPGIEGRVDMNYIYGQESVSSPSKKEKYPYQLPKLPKRGWFASGDTGDEVKKLQRFLHWETGLKIYIDGICGGQTINAVKQYQENQGLTVDGCFGEKSLARAKML